MAVGFRSSSIRGVSDQNTTSCAIPVPAGAAAGDIVVCFVGSWSNGGTITPPAGFTLISGALQGVTRLSAYWKRLTGPDTGSYTFTWPDTGWNNGSAVCLTGGVATGDPIEQFTTGGARGTSYPTLGVTTATVPGLVWGAYNESLDTTHDVPDSFTGVAAQDYGTTAYRLPATTGTHTATGATASSTMDLVVVFAAIKPEAASGQSIAVGQSLETDTVTAITSSKARSVGQVLQTEAASDIVPSKHLFLGQAVETDTAQSISTQITKHVAIGQATGGEVSSSITPVKSRLVDTAVEASTANPFTVSGGVVLLWPPKAGAPSSQGISAGESRQDLITAGDPKLPR